MGFSDAPPFPAMTIAEAHARLNVPGGQFELGEETVRGVPLKIWKNAPPTLREVFEETAHFKGHDALVYEGERVNYAGYRAASITLAHRLIADGLRKGDRVALAMRNLPEWPIAFWAAMLAGAIVVPMNAWWTGEELDHALADSDARFAILDDERRQRLHDFLPARALAHVYVTRGAAEIGAATRLEAVIGAPSDYHALTERAPPDIPLAPDDDVTIFYTSGTTDWPKGVVSSHRNVIANIWNAANAAARGFLRNGAEPPASDPAARRKAHLMTVPFFHVIGCFANMIPHAMNGVKLVLMRRWDADIALPLIERERIQSVFGVPTIAWQILEHPRFREYDLSSLEAIAYGGAPAPAELAARIRERFPAVRPAQGWGMTETSGTAITNPGEDYRHRPESCGVPSMTGQAKIADEHGNELPRGAVGELWYKGPVVARGYWNRPQETARTFVDGWVRTGDLARMDEEGFVFIVDRLKDMVIRGGENIYCVEVENALYAHPAVMDAAVIGVPHRTLGEEPAAIVHLKPGASASEEELRAHVGGKLAAYKVPVEIMILPYPLPRNPNGKILKRELKVLFA